MAAGVAVATGVAVSALGDRTPPPVSDRVASYLATPPPVPTPKPAPVAAFLGDSFTAGDGLTDRANRWSSVLAAKEGWIEVNVGIGGTGYESDGKLSDRTTYLERMPELVKKNPSIVVISGGGNDLSAHRDSPALVEDAIRATYTQVRKALPKARIIAVGPDWGVDAPEPTIAAIDATVRASAASVKAEYVDLKRPLDGKKALMLPDGGHPDTGGHAAIAEAAYKAIKQG